MYVRNVWICRKIEYADLRKFNWKLCTLYARNVWISRKIEYLEFHIFNRKLCALYMYGMSEVADKLKVQNFLNLMGNCIHNMYEMSGFAEKLNIQNYENLTEKCVHYTYRMLGLGDNWISRTKYIHWKIVYIIYVWNISICREIECPEQCKLNGKLYI